ncbi:hypothetical protein [Streptomyces sp. enrichment culture]|uniref:hypothetical protein n=1 Tax=Streptomyces sp. enrichment culture TaxID=1795815 RepID=UPI003F55213D
MPSRPTTRRGFFGIAGAAAVTAAGVTPLPVVGAAPAHAATAAGTPVLGPDHPDAEIPDVSDADFADGVSREPLNLSVDCALTPEGTR